VSKLNVPIYLKPDVKSSSLHQFLEHYVFWRIPKFKNNPRGNYILIRAFLIVFSVFILACITGLIMLSLFSVIPQFTPWDGLTQLLTVENFIKLFIGFLGSTTVSYWNINSLFNRKWTYSANLYNKIVEHRSSSTSCSTQLENAFAIDLLTLDLWAHRSYADLFAHELERCILDKYSDLGNRSDWFEKINNDNLTESEAWELLNYRHSNIVALHSGSNQKTKIQSELPNRATENKEGEVG
jgi:hypothetical protein